VFSSDVPGGLLPIIFTSGVRTVRDIIRVDEEAGFEAIQAI